MNKQKKKTFKYSSTVNTNFNSQRTVNDFIRLWLQLEFKQFIIKKNTTTTTISIQENNQLVLATSERQQVNENSQIGNFSSKKSGVRFGDK